MSEAEPREATEESSSLAHEQLLTSLDQTIGDREQAVADHARSLLDDRQLDLDAERLAGGTPSPAGKAAFAERQDELDRAEARGDAYQTQLDATQGGRDGRQEVLDSQHREAARAPGAPNANAEFPRVAALDRARNDRKRGEAAIERAVEADERATRTHG